MMRRTETFGNCVLVLGDCTKEAPGFQGVHACVTDPPYHLTSIVKRFGGKYAAPAKVGETGAYARASAGFMGQTWDGGDIAFRPDTWQAIGSALLPGAHLAAFSGTRTYHRMAVAIEDAGFEIRDMLSWLYGSGFPKSHNLDGEWDGWGSALKPACEPIAFARKPLIGTIAENVLEHGTGALNIDATRVTSGDDHAAKCASVVGLDSRRNKACYGDWAGERSDSYSPLGRWPANVITDGSLDVYGCFPREARESIRFFYAAKASAEEREFGLEGAPTKRGGMVSNTSGQHITRRDGGEPGPRANHHPTVKPVSLMAWLCRLITPPGGTILDPFMGSGSTGIAAVRNGFHFIGIEQSEEYFDIACRRIEAAVKEAESGLKMQPQNDREPPVTERSLFDATDENAA